MTSGEIAVLVTAVGVSLAAILTSVAALINARNSKDIVERLRAEILKLQEHNIDQDRLIFDREVELGQLKRENVVLTEKIRLWHEWGQTIGRAMNKMQLMIGYLTTHQQTDSPIGITPLPAMPDPPDSE